MKEKTIEEFIKELDSYLCSLLPYNHLKKIDYWDEETDAFKQRKITYKEKCKIQEEIKSILNLITTLNNYTYGK